MTNVIPETKIANALESIAVSAERFVSLLERVFTEVLKRVEEEEARRLRDRNGVQ